ncbi:unnamed protein product, partial [Didymodactylos carnosus]
YLIPDNKTSRNTTDLFNDIISCCLDHTFDLKKNEIENIYFFRNSQINKQYTEKKASFDKNYKEKFIFQILPTLDVARSIASKGIHCDQLALFVDERLGQSSQGVHVLRHADIILTSTGSQKLISFGLLICKVALSKGYCTVPDIKNATLACQPNYDYHYGKRNPTKEETWREKYAHSLLYVYEYGMKTMTHTVQPPQILPIACLWYQLNESFPCESWTVKIPPLLQHSSLKIVHNTNKKIDRRPLNKPSILNQEQLSHSVLSPIQSIITNRITSFDNTNTGWPDIINSPMITETHSLKQQKNTFINQTQLSKQISMLNVPIINSTIATPIGIAEPQDIILKLSPSSNRSIINLTNHSLIKHQNITTQPHHDVNETFQNNHSSVNFNINNNNIESHSLLTSVSSDFLMSDKQFHTPSTRDPRIRRTITTTKTSTLNVTDLNSNVLPNSPTTIRSPSLTVTPTEVAALKKTILDISSTNKLLQHTTKSNNISQQKIIQQNEMSPSTPVTPTNTINDDGKVNQYNLNPLFASITSLDVPLKMNTLISDPRLKLNRKKVIYCLEPHAVKRAIQQQLRCIHYNSNDTTGSKKSPYHLIPFLIKQISLDENENLNISAKNSSFILAKQQTKKNGNAPSLSTSELSEKPFDDCQPLRVVVQDVTNFNFDFTTDNENYIDLSNETNKNVMRQIINFNKKIQQNRETNVLKQRLKQSLKKKRVRKRKSKTAAHVYCQQAVENMNENLTIEQQQIESTENRAIEEIPTAIITAISENGHILSPNESSSSNNTEALVKDARRLYFFNGREILTKQRRQNNYLNIPKDVTNFLSKEFYEEKRPYVKRLLAQLMGILDEKYGRIATTTNSETMRNSMVIDNSNLTNMEFTSNGDVRLGDFDERFPSHYRKSHNCNHHSIIPSDNHHTTDFTPIQTYQNTNDCNNLVLDERMKEIIDDLRLIHQPSTQQLFNDPTLTETSSTIEYRKQSKTTDELVNLIENSGENSTSTSSRKQSCNEINNHILPYQQPDGNVPDISSTLAQKPIEVHKEITTNVTMKNNTFPAVLDTFTKPDPKLNNSSTKKSLSSKHSESQNLRRTRTYSSSKSTSSVSSGTNASSSFTSSSSSPRHRRLKRHNIESRKYSLSYALVQQLLPFSLSSIQTSSSRRGSTKGAFHGVSSLSTTTSRSNWNSHRHAKPSQQVKIPSSHRTDTFSKSLRKTHSLPSTTNRRRPSVSSSSQQLITPLLLSSIVVTQSPSRSNSIHLSHPILDNSSTVLPQYPTISNSYNSEFESRRRVESCDDIFGDSANQNDNFGLTVNCERTTVKTSKKRQIEQSLSLKKEVDESEKVNGNRNEFEINNLTANIVSVAEPIAKRIKIENVDVDQQQKQPSSPLDSPIDMNDIDANHERTRIINRSHTNEKENMINKNEKINDGTNFEGGFQHSLGNIILTQLQNDNVRNASGDDVQDRDYRFDFENRTTVNQQSHTHNIKNLNENVTIEEQNDFDERLLNNVIDIEKQNPTNLTYKRRSKSNSFSSVKDEKLNPSRLSSTNSRNSSKNSFYRNNNNRSNSRSPIHHQSSSYHRHDLNIHHHNQHSPSQSNRRTKYSLSQYHHRSTSQSTRSSRSRSPDKYRTVITSASSHHPYDSRYYPTSTSNVKTSLSRSHSSRSRQQTSTTHLHDNRQQQRDRDKSQSPEHQHRYFVSRSKSPPQHQGMHSASLLPSPLIKTTFNNSEIPSTFEHKLSRMRMIENVQNNNNVQTRYPHTRFNYNHQRLINHPRYNTYYYNKIRKIPSTISPPYRLAQSTHDILTDNQHLRRSRSISPTHSTERLRINCTFSKR